MVVYTSIYGHTSFSMWFLSSGEFPLLCQQVSVPLLSRPMISYRKGGTTPTQESRVLVNVSTCMVMLVSTCYLFV